jgi:hypothetical protein
LSNSDTVKLNAIATLATDTILFLMTLAGLLYLRLQGVGMLSLGDRLMVTHFRFFDSLVLLL